MKIEHKKVLRCFLLEKLREVANYELCELAEKHDCHPFYMTEQFSVDIDRIEKLFCYPHYDN